MKWRQRPGMTIDVDWDVKHQYKQTNTPYQNAHMYPRTICPLILT